MTLSVIVPDQRPGMQRMLATELQFIDSEVIYDSWRSGLEKAQGDFVCLLEWDSGLSKGSIARQLAPFLENPRFRKLAMVAPLIEFDDSEPMCLSLTGDNHNERTHYQLAQVGSLGGSVIRRSSLIKHLPEMVDLIDGSYLVSIAFWENGLRVMNDPESIYYSPGSSHEMYIEVHAPSPTLQSLWQRECVT